MILIGILIILIPKEKEKTAIYMGFQSDRKELSPYRGDYIKAETQVMPYVYEDKKIKDNGKRLKDNGAKYAIKVNKRQNVVTIYKSDAQGWYTVPVKAMVCSAGLGNNTPDGVYRLGDRSGPFGWMWMVYMERRFREAFCFILWLILQEAIVI